MTRAQLTGFEYDWLAVDHLGQLALLSTAGSGFVPTEVARTMEAHQAALDVLFARPPSTEVRRAPVFGPGVDNTWAKAAARGVFGFDSDPNGGPYRLVAVPRTPLLLTQLSADLCPFPIAVPNFGACFGLRQRAGSLVHEDE